MTDREYRLRLTIDRLRDALERERAISRSARRSVTLYRRAYGVLPYAKPGKPRYRECADCGRRCRGRRCQPCAMRHPDYGRAMA